MQTTFKENLYQLDKERTWTDIHEGKKKYTTTGWLCGIEISSMDEPVRKMDEFLKTITVNTVIIPNDVALNLYNTANKLAEFEGQTHVRTIRNGLGSAGTRKEYKFEDNFHQIKTGMHELKWHTCTPEFIAYYFCTESQYRMIEYVFGRVPGVLYL